MGMREIHIHQYQDVRQVDGTIRKMCMICGKVK
jgi:hypothetical protein